MTDFVTAVKRVIQIADNHDATVNGGFKCGIIPLFQRKIPAQQTFDQFIQYEIEQLPLCHGIQGLRLVLLVSSSIHRRLCFLSVSVVRRRDVLPDGKNQQAHLLREPFHQPGSVFSYHSPRTE